MRVCDGCGNKMAPFSPRKRVGDQMLCKACLTRPGGGRVTAGLDSGTRTEGPTTGQLHRYQDGSIFLNALSTEHLARGQGSGTNYLLGLIAQADREGVAIHTVPGN